MVSVIASQASWRLAAAGGWWWLWARVFVCVHSKCKARPCGAVAVHRCAAQEETPGIRGWHLGRLFGRTFLTNVLFPSVTPVYEVT